MRLGHAQEGCVWALGGQRGNPDTRALRPAPWVPEETPDPQQATD
jgi:hypothetical protein